jgi:copper chaperone CopZ
MGWDTVDELLTRYYNWEISVDKSLEVKHLKPTGSEYNKKSRYKQGEAFYCLGYGFWITFLASLKLAFKKKKPLLFIDYLKGFFKAKKEKKRSKKEDKTMKKIMHIEGMMCGHCEAAVKKALEALPQVDEAVVSHEAGTAELTLNAEIADDVLKKTVEDKDYTVTSVE